MKVGLVLPYSDEGTAGGVNSVAYNTVEGFKKIERRLEKENLEIIVLSSKGNHYRINKSSLDHSHSSLTHYSYKSIPLRWLAGEIQAIYNLQRLELDLDLIHAHSLPFAVGGSLLDYPTLYTIHGIKWKEQKHERTLAGKLSKLVETKKLPYLVDSVEEIISISPYVRQEFNFEFTVDPLSFSTIENPVSDVFYQIPLNTESNQILCPALIRPRKNQLMLIKSLRMLRDEGIEFQAVFTGNVVDEDYFGELQEVINNNDLSSSVDFMGYVPKERLEKLYSESSIVCLPSYQETAPMVVAEAMASGTPVVATDVGGTKHMLSDGESGFLIDPDDTHNLKSKLKDLLTSSSLRKEMGETGRSNANRWRSEVIANQLVDKYLEYE